MENTVTPGAVSMKSGLEGRNNFMARLDYVEELLVSMKSGLEGRNNLAWRVEQNPDHDVSMKSGLEGRNNRVEYKPGSPLQ